MVVEDDKEIRSLITMHLSNEGYEIVEAVDGNEAKRLFDNNYDLVLLDIMLPFVDGIELLKQFRKISPVPIIMLTALGEEKDRVKGLDLGADDYIVKPFGVKEMITRVKANLRRYNRISLVSEDGVIRNGELKLVKSQYKLFKNEEEISLNPQEYKIILLFLENVGKIFTKKQIYEKAWEEVYTGDDNTLMVHISHLRDKIEDNSKNQVYISTIRGIGYRMEKVDA